MARTRTGHCRKCWPDLQMQILAILILGLARICITTAEISVHDPASDAHSHEFARVHRIRPKLLTNPETNTYQTHYRARRAVENEEASNGHPHPHRVTLELPFISRGHGQGNPEVVTNHVLDLHLNRDLIPGNYFLRTQASSNDKGHPVPVIHRPEPEKLKEDHCHYHGTVRGRPGSWAALSTCDKALRGVVFDGHELHYLEPAASNGTAIKNGLVMESLHFRDSDRVKNLTCGSEGTHFHFDAISDFEYGTNTLNDTTHSRKKRAASGTPPLPPWNSNPKSRYVELVLVVDNRKFVEAGRDLRAVESRTKEIANIVNVLYAPLNIFIALVGVVVWNEQDEITLSPKGDETLASFLRYRRERLLRDHPNDNAQLLTAFEFEEGVVGKAMQGPICSYKYSGGVNSDYKSVLGVVATTVAHELGHNFGLSHDTDTCTCDGPASKCIMSASSSSNRTAHWSSCSKDAIAYAFKHGMDYCLKNEPAASLWQGPVCGNGWTEPGEECDCGHVEQCANPCCDAHTCRLHANATCGAGPCCDFATCHPRAGGTVCRSPKSVCDLPEYCDGEGATCPGDVHRQDGATCRSPSGASAFCYAGSCRAHTDQCKLLWGPSGVSSIDACYSKNVNGSRYGHCGYNLATEQYARCAAADVACGALQCRHEEEKLQYGYEQVAILSTFFLNAGGTISPCRSVTTDFGLDVVDPGLTPDGAPCGGGGSGKGDSRMCVKQKCVTVSSILASFTCPGGGNCNENGVCNSKGHCHCDDGYGGDACDAGGFGGSVDSGPALNPYSTHGLFAKALYVTFLGVIPLIAVISFYVYYAGDNVKRVVGLCLRGRLAVSWDAVRLQATRAYGGAKTHMTQNGHGPRGGGGAGASNTNHNSTSSSGAPAAPTAADDFFGQYKGFSLSPVRAGGGGTSNGGPHYQNLSNSPPAKGAAPAPPVQPQGAVIVQTTTLLKNENRSPRTATPPSLLQKGTTQARVSWAHPIAHTTAISPEGAAPSGVEEGNPSNCPPLYENSASFAIKGSTRAVRPLSSPDALEAPPIGASPYVSAVPSPRSFSAGLFGGSTSALQRLASAWNNSFVRSVMKSSTSTENAANAAGISPPCAGAARAGIARQKSFNRDSLQISQPILAGAVSAQIEAKMLGQHLVPAGDVVDGAAPSVAKDTKFRNGSPGPRYTNVPTDSPSSLPPSTSKPASPKFIGKSLVAKPFSRNLVRLKSQSPERSPSNSNSSTTSTGPASSKPVVKGGSPPPVPRPNPKPTVTRAQSMNQPNRNSIGGSNYNSLRRSRPTAPPPAPPPTGPPPPPPTEAAVPPPTKTASPPARPKYQSCIGGRFTSRNEPTLLSLNTAAAKARAASASNSSTAAPGSLFAPLAKIDDMNSPSASSIGSTSDIKTPGAQGGGVSENIYDTIDEGEGGTDLRGVGNSFLEEKIETLSTGSSENGGLLSEIISEISSRNRESIYNSMDRRKMRRDKKTVGANVNSQKPAGSSSPKPTRKTPAPVPQTPPTSTTVTPPSAATLNSTRITVNPGFDKIIKPPSPVGASKSGMQHQVTPPYTPKPAVVAPPVKTKITPPALIPVPKDSTPGINSDTAAPVIPPHGPYSTATAAATAAAAATKPMCAVNGIPKTHQVPTNPPAAVPTTSSNSASYMARMNYFTGAGLHPVHVSSPSSKAETVHMKPITSLSQSLSHSPAPSSILGGGASDTCTGDGKETIYAPGQLSTIRRSRQYKPYPNLIAMDNGSGGPKGAVNGHRDSLVNGSSNSTGVYARPTPVPTPQVPSLPRKLSTDSSSSSGVSSSGSTRTLPTNYTANIMDIGTKDEQLDELAKAKAKAASLGGVGGAATIGGYKSFHPYLNRPLTFSTFGRNSKGSSTGGGGTNGTGRETGPPGSILGVTN